MKKTGAAGSLAPGFDSEENIFFWSHGKTCIYELREAAARAINSQK